MYVQLPKFKPISHPVNLSISLAVFIINIATGSNFYWAICSFLCCMFSLTALLILENSFENNVRFCLLVGVFIVPIFSPTLISLFTGTSIQQSIIQSDNLITVYTLGTFSVLVASILASTLHVSSRPKPLDIAAKLESTCSSKHGLTTSFVCWLILFVFHPPVLSILIKPFFVFTVVSLISNLKSENLPAKTVAALLLFMIVLTIQRDALTGMKSAILLPLILPLVIISLYEIKLRIDLILVGSIVLLIAGMAASSLVPLRHLKKGPGSNNRKEIAMALIISEIRTFYPLEISNENEALVASVAKESSDPAEESDNSSLIRLLNRFTYIHDDSLMINAISEKGPISWDAMLNEIIIFPRFVTENFTDDKESAFLGRYAGAIGPNNYSTGIAFSVFVRYYALGGYLLVFVGTLLSTLVTIYMFNFIVKPNYKITALSFIFILFSLNDSNLVLSGIWKTATRSIPLLIFSCYLFTLTHSLATRFLQPKRTP